MPEFKLGHEFKFSTTECASCGLVFALPAHLEKMRREDHRSFFCPNGHTLVFSAKSEAEQAREELERTRKDLGARLSAANERANAAEAATAKAEAAASKARQRIGGGTCPCCKRHFRQVARHMENKHPDYRKEPPLP